MSQTIGTIVANAGQRKMKKEGQRMQNEAQNAIDNFQWQDIDGALPIHTEGADLITEQNQLSTATAMDAVRNSGTRGIVGTVPKLVAQNNVANQEARAYLDNQYMRRDYTKLGMIENRQANELAGYGQQLNTGMGMKYKAYSDFYATASNQSQHIMDLWSTFGGAGGGMKNNSNNNLGSSYQEYFNSNAKNNIPNNLDYNYSFNDLSRNGSTYF